MERRDHFSLKYDLHSKNLGQLFNSFVNNIETKHSRQIFSTEMAYLRIFGARRSDHCILVIVSSFITSRDKGKKLD